MKYRVLVALVAFFAAVGTAGAADMLITPPADGCDRYCPYVWVELAPGQTWSVDIDLSQCSADELGMFRYYGHINQGKKTGTIRTSDGVSLSVEDLSTAQDFISTASGRKAEEYVVVSVDQPTTLRLSATNETKKKKMVRMTWLSATY